MKRAPVKSASLAESLARRDKLLQAIGQLLQETNTLWSQVVAQVESTTHNETPELLILNKECSVYLTEFRRLSDVAQRIKIPLERKIEELKQKGPGTLPKPMPAKSFQTIVMLHLVGEQAIGRRLEELNEIEKRRKDILQQFEMGFTMCQERFNELVTRLNLLLFMRDCVERDGVLPANILYMTRIPQTVTSPFFVLPSIPVPTPESEAKAPLPKLDPSTVSPSPAPGKSARNDPERIKQELEKRRKLLMQLREQAQKQAQNDKK